jgi:hypothetical protein
MGYFAPDQSPIEAITRPDPTPEARDWFFMGVWPEQGAIWLFDRLSVAVGLVLVTPEELAVAGEWRRGHPWLETARVRVEVPTIDIN